MLFRLLYNDNLAHAAYLIGCQRTGEAIVVDPARDVDRYIEEAQRQGLSLVAAAETHIHADFLSGCRELAEQVGLRLYLSDEGDADWKYRWLDARSTGGRYDHRLVKDGDTFSVGNIEFRVRHTPGHTPEHIVFLVTDRGGGAEEPMGVLTGDFVFVGDLGRPDLLETAAGVEGVKEEAARTLGRSAAEFLGLEDYLQLWPAHGAGSACGKALGAVPQTTLGYERRYNPALRLARDLEAFSSFILEGQPEPPLYFARMKAQNRDGVPLLGKLPQPAALSRRALEALDTTRPFVVDTRPWNTFRAGHLRGSLFAPLGNAFHTVVGSYIEPADEIVLVAEASRVEALVRELVRIGLDRVTSFVTPEVLVSAGMALETVPEVSVDELRTRLDEPGGTVVDVRRSAELVDGSIARDAVLAPHTRLPKHLSALPQDQPLFVHCARGNRSAYASAYLRRLGYDAVNVAGGIEAWKTAGHPLQDAATADRMA